MKLILNNQTARARITSSFLPVMLGSLGPSLFPSIAIGDSYGDAYMADDINEWSNFV